MRMRGGAAVGVLLMCVCNCGARAFDLQYMRSCCIACCDVLLVVLTQCASLGCKVLLTFFGVSWVGLACHCLT